MEKFDFEMALKELEGIVETLEKGEISLENSMELFEKGVTLSKKCSSYLDGAKQKIIMLTDAETEEEADD